MTGPSGPPVPSGPPAGVPTCYRHPDRETYVRCQRCEKPICPDCMRDAAVGFQCPDCVKEGAKNTRQAQAAYGGRRVADPRITTFVLMGLNALVWVAILATGWTKSTLINRLALIPDGACASKSEPDRGYDLVTEQACRLRTANPGDGQWFPGVAEGSYWQLVTSMFTHVEVVHIALNMLVLFFLGPQVETVLGRARYLALFVVSGLTGSVFVYWLSGENTATVGASGAVFGLLGALLVIAYKVRGNVQTIIYWLAINAAFTFLFPGISWQGHLGGFLGGLLVTAIVVYAPKARRQQLQAAGITLVVAGLVVATVARTVVLA